MENDIFGETNFSFPKISNKENSTYYKTFYSGIPGKKQINNSNSKTGSNSSKVLIGQNRALSSFAKYTSQLPNNLNNKNKRKRLTSLVRNKNSLSSAETDDTFFALSEIKQMDKKISKRINKNLIWKEKLNNIYDICTFQNKKDIEKVREGVRIYETGDDFDLKAEIDKKNIFQLKRLKL